MGGGRFDPADWQNYTTKQNYASKSTAQIFSSTGMVPELDPKGMKAPSGRQLRESRDGKDNPNSTPIICGLDVTGSMERVLDVMARKGLPKLATEIYDRKPVTDPHFLCAGIGDVACGDRAPLQVTQFEADIRIAKQLEQLFLEKGGGGNGSESYALAWYFAAKHTAIDSWEKRQKKGYLFTVGDDGPTPFLRPEEIERVFGYRPEAQFSAQQILTLASRQWEVFHIIVEEGGTFSRDLYAQWRDLLGERVLRLQDHKCLPEVIVSTLQIHAGADSHKVAESWGGDTAIVVRNATGHLAPRKGQQGGIVTL